MSSMPRASAYARFVNEESGCNAGRGSIFSSPCGSNRLRRRSSNPVYAGANPAGDTMDGRQIEAGCTSLENWVTRASREQGALPWPSATFAPVGNRKSPSLRMRFSAGATPAWSTNGYEYESSTLGLGPRRGGAVPPYPTISRAVSQQQTTPFGSERSQVQLLSARPFKSS